MGSCVSKSNVKTDIDSNRDISPGPDDLNGHYVQPNEVLESPEAGKNNSQQNPARMLVEYTRVRLVGDLLSPQTASLYMALKFKGVPLDVEWLDSTEMSTSRPEWFQQLSPITKVPIFVHDSNLIYNADEALEYVDHAFPYPPLVPEGPDSEEILMLAKFAREKVAPIVQQALLEQFPAKLRTLGPSLESAFDKLERKLLDWRENRGGPYFFGEDFTLVDCILAPILDLEPLLQNRRGIGFGRMHGMLRQYAQALQSMPLADPVRRTTKAVESHVMSNMYRDKLPPTMLITVLQHQSIRKHLQWLVQATDALADTKQRDERGPRAGQPIRELWLRYGQLLEIMQEHAQMEERVLFPVFEDTKPGLTSESNAEHARHLPVMNGIHEDMKSAMSLEFGSPVCREAVLALAIRIRNFQAATVEHFDAEETDLLPHMTTLRRAEEMEQTLLERCLEVMENAHKRLLPFLLTGLKPHEIEQYVDTVRAKLGGEYLVEVLTTMLSTLQTSNPNLCVGLQERMRSMKQMLLGAGA